MQMMVPTVWVEAMLSRPLTVAGRHFKAGELVKVSYGVGLQGLAEGTFSCFRNEAEKHAEAVEHLQVYGPDSWFPAPMQSIGKLWAALEAKRAERGLEPDVPRNPDGEIIH